MVTTSEIKVGVGLVVDTLMFTLYSALLFLCFSLVKKKKKNSCHSREYGSVVEHVPGIHGTLGSIPRTEKEGMNEERS